MFMHYSASLGPNAHPLAVRESTIFSERVVACALGTGIPRDRNWFPRQDAGTPNDKQHPKARRADLQPQS
jgi:hypothetical protein